MNCTLGLTAFEHGHSTLAEVNVHMISPPVVEVYGSRPSFLRSGDGSEHPRVGQGLSERLQERTCGVCSI
jgi:hypothetical protein